eukprot:TRINITY_DN3595_c0_g1_i1.p1 TRINITY_DN3595_c0_g1~~TRINITY_DN3595_c0_g1_i1.p1  ORF type:complete len:1098 (-),score=430.43 TRINITY_DN3595_c0_g1_i1:176-3469(-)
MKGFKDLLSKGSEAVKATAASAAAKAGQLKDRVGKALPSIGRSFDINGRTYRSKKLIGEGGFGFVYLVENVDSGQGHALKQLNVATRDQLQQAQNEINLMRALSYSKYIVKLQDSTIQRRENGSEVLVLMEFCSGGGLTDLLNDYFARGKKLPEADIFAIFQDICCGVATLHNRDEPIAHRDLKVENVLLGSDNIWKLCDFGSATTKTYRCDSERERNQAEDDIQKNTTMDYRAPEMIDLFRKQLINTKADIWALGVLLYRLAFFQNPFEEGSPLGILNCNYEIPENSKFSEALHSLIRTLLTTDPALRPDINAVLATVSQLTGRNVDLSKPPKDVPAPTPAQATFDDDRRTPSPAPSKAPAAKNLLDILDWSDEAAAAASQPVHQHSTAHGSGRGGESLVDFSAGDSATDNNGDRDGGPRRGGYSQPAGYSDPNSNKSRVAARPIAAPGAPSRGTPPPSHGAHTPSKATKGPLKVVSFGIENSDAVTSFLQRLKKKPLAADPAKCLQYVIPLHQFLLSAPPSVLTETYVTLYAFIESLRDKYTEQRIKDTDAEPAELLSQYAALLAKKVFFHRRFAQFNGDLTINEGVTSIPLNKVFVREVLELQRHVCSVLALVLPGSGTPSEPKLAAVPALMQEAFAVYQLALFAIIKNYGDGSVPAEFVDAFRAQFAMTSDAFAQVRSLHSRWRLDSSPLAVPELPLNAPELSSAVTAIRISSKKVTQIAIPIKPIVEPPPQPAPTRRPGEPPRTAPRVTSPSAESFAPVSNGDQRGAPAAGSGSRTQSPAPAAEPSRLQSSGGKATPPLAPGSESPELSAARTGGSQTSVDKLKNTDLNALHQKILAELRRLPENKVCADCGRSDPTWAVVNLGIFVCLYCSGIHRSLGTHISKVRSVTLDTWEQEFVDHMKAIGNKRAREIYEAGVPPGYQVPRENDSQYKIKQWIISKYDKKEFMRGPAPPFGAAAAASGHQRTPSQTPAADLFSFDPDPPARTASPAVQPVRTPSPAVQPAGNLMDFGLAPSQPHSAFAPTSVAAHQASAFDDPFFAAASAPARPSPTPSPVPASAAFGSSGTKAAAAAPAKPNAAGNSKLFDMLDWQQ